MKSLANRFFHEKKSERQDLNLRPLPPQGSTLPSCATSRFFLFNFQTQTLGPSCFLSLGRYSIFLTRQSIPIFKKTQNFRFVWHATPLLEMFTEHFSSAECHVPIFLFNFQTQTLGPSCFLSLGRYSIFLTRQSIPIFKKTQNFRFVWHATPLLEMFTEHFSSAECHVPIFLFNFQIFIV